MSIQDKAAQAEYRDKNREALRLANRMGVSLRAARDAIDLLALAPDAGAEFESEEDAARPSAGETIEQRIVKNHWRGKIVDGFMGALATGDFREFQRIDGELRKALTVESDRPRRGATDDATAANVRKLRAENYSIRQIAATMGIGKTTVQDILTERYAAKGEKPKMDLTIIVKRAGKPIVEFDASDGKLVLMTMTEPDAKKDARVALRRAYYAALDQWGKGDESRRDD